MWAGPHSLLRLQVRVLPCLFQLLGAQLFPGLWQRHSSLCLHCHSAFSPHVSTHSPLCVSVSLLIRTTVTELRAHPTSLTNLITSAKTLFLNKVNTHRSQGLDFRISFWGDNSAHSSALSSVPRALPSCPRLCTRLLPALLPTDFRNSTLRTQKTQEQPKWAPLWGQLLKIKRTLDED